MAFAPSHSKSWVLITGASSGIGEAFARRFAKDGWNVVLVARALDRLSDLAQSLAQEHQVSTLVVGADLSSRDACSYVYGQTQQAGIEVEGLVNNAGFGVSGTFIEGPLERYLAMIDLHVRSVTELTHLYLVGMVRRRRGFVINVSSLVSFIPLPYGAVYAATKAFVTSFSEALWLELKGTGVRVLNVCPGLTKTDFGTRADGRDFRKSPIAEPPEAVVESALRALGRRQPTVISGWGNWLLVFAERSIPHRLLLPLVLAVQKIRKGV